MTFDDLKPPYFDQKWPINSFLWPQMTFDDLKAAYFDLKWPQNTFQWPKTTSDYVKNINSEDSN